MDSDTGYLLDMATECVADIERLQSLLMPSDDGELVTVEWLESVGLIGEHDLGFGMRLNVYAQTPPDIEYSSSGWYREYASLDLHCHTRGDFRALARLCGIKLRDG